MSSTSTLGANANATLVTPSSPRPTSTVARTPAFAHSQPLGSAPANVPAAYEATGTPAPPFVSPNSSANCGRSGVIAA